jgi:hypothetical protein
MSPNVLAYLSVASWRAEYFLREYFLKVAKMFQLAKCSDCKYAVLAVVARTKQRTPYFPQNHRNYHHTSEARILSFDKQIMQHLFSMVLD